MINPGTDPVPDASIDHADTNIAGLVLQLQRRGVGVDTLTRDEGADVGGRFGYRLALADGQAVSVSMPGVPLAELQGMGATVPCLYVEGNAWWWRDAVGQITGIAAGPNAGRILK